MFEWYESFLERLTRRFRFALLARLYPELSRVRNERERQWAMWFAADSTPVWKRLAQIIMITILGPGLATLAAFGLLKAFGMTLLVSPPLAVFVSWMGGFIVTLVVVEKIRGRGLRHRWYLAMRISGHDVCPNCCYDMAGHESAMALQRLCPECGSPAPAPELSTGLRKAG